MKFNNLTKSVIAFSVLSMLASGALMASAASNTNATGTASTTGTANIAGKNHGRGLFKGLLKEEKIKPKNMTDAQKAALEVKKAAMDAKRVAGEAAITASDYPAWVAAVTAINENSPLLTEITADNFNKYVEAMKLRLQAETIMKDLGINGSGPDGFGSGMQGLGMGGFGRGGGRGQK